MNVFEARQLTDQQNATPTEQSIFSMVDKIIFTTASHGYTSIRFIVDDFLRDLITRYMTANGFLRVDDIWYWFNPPPTDSRLDQLYFYRPDAVYFGVGDEPELRLCSYRLETETHHFYDERGYFEPHEYEYTDYKQIVDRRFVFENQRLVEKEVHNEGWTY